MPASPAAASSRARGPVGGRAQRRPGRSDARWTRCGGPATRARHDGSVPAPLEEALRTAPPRRPARPHPAQLWRKISVDDRAGTVCRPHGVEIDTGGTGKGLCADAVAQRLRRYTRFVVDCGGDIAIGGIGAQLEPYEVEVEHPLTGETIRSVRLGSGGIATSGLNVRVWRDGQGGFAHHLLDPATGRPAWTGLVGVTALASSALEAETLSKMALLSGPLGARRVLAIARRGDRPRRRRRRGDRATRRVAPALAGRLQERRVSTVKDPTPYLPWLVSRASGIVATRTRHVGRAARPDDVLQAAAPPRRSDVRSCAARARRPRGHGRDRRARLGAARRPLAAPRAAAAWRSRSRWATGRSSPDSASSPAISRRCSA